MDTEIFAANDISGFIEHTVPVMSVMEKVKSKIAKVYCKYGFLPFETRLVEDAKVLNQKGIDSKELFSLNFLSKGVEYEPGEERRISALRFDLTVPLARYVGQHAHQISFPFKRYQIQKVYRAEQAKTATGRYNEFYQSDIDVIGQGSIDFNYDSEFPAVICDVFKNIFGLERFVIRISNRKFLEGLFVESGLTEVSLIKRAVKVIDDIEKVDSSVTVERLNALGLDLSKAKELLVFFNTVFDMNPLDAVAYLRNYGFKDALTLEGISELDIVINGVVSNGVDQKYFRVDPRIARGLDYYTGTVYETLLLDYPELGSVCSGGRYDDLVGTLTGNDNDKYPGVGISIGLSRLVPTLIAKGFLKPKDYMVANILVSCQDKKYINKYIEIGRTLRNAGHNIEVYMQRNRKLAAQLEYADKRGFKYVLIGNKYEFNENKINVRNMETKENTTVHLDDLVSYFKH